MRRPSDQVGRGTASPLQKRNFAMKLHTTYQPKEGYTCVVKPREMGIEFITFGILDLKEDSSDLNDTASNEAVLVLLNGKCRVEVGHGGNKADVILGPRNGVFSSKAFSIYLPPKTTYKVTAIESTELAIAKAPSEADDAPVAIVTPDKVKERVVGSHNWRRYVNDVIGMDIKAGRMIVGETFNPPGNWSSAPPHRHERDELPLESDMEEVYFYKIDPPKGFGMQMVYTEDGSIDEAYTIRNNDLVAIPRGYHPVVAGPGYRLYYLWVLAGKKRILKQKDDPEHVWVKHSESIISEL